MDDKETITIPVDIESAVNEAFEQEGEIDRSFLPVTEWIFPWIGTFSKGFEENVEDDLSTWSNSENKRRVRNLPPRFLQQFLLNEDETMEDLELSGLIERSIRKGLIVDPGGANKLMAMKAVNSSIGKDSGFHKHPTNFLFLSAALNGFDSTADKGNLPSVEDLCVAVDYVFTVTPSSFSLNVLGTGASVCMMDGCWALPESLSVFQSYIYNIAEGGDRGRYDITKEKVKRVKDAVREGSGSIEALPDVEKQQALLLQFYENYSDAVAILSDKLISKLG